MHRKVDPAISRIFLLSVGCIFVLALPLAAAPAGNHWMEAIGNSVRLSQMTIPGTHDSGALVEGPLAGTAKCQNATIAEQLGYGVRFLDIRCKHENNAFAIYHGSVNQNLTFTQVMDQVTGFLNANPSECVIMSIKEEGASSGATRSFEATFDSYVAANPARWALGTSVPSLSGVRGKIQLLRRFGATVAKGINATNWPDNTTFLVNNLSVQDRYQVPDNTEKWTSITNALSAAFSETNADVLHLNFTSGYKPGLFGIPNITTVSNAINPQLETYFGTAPPGKYGCVVMDFADATRPALIYNTNFIAPVFTTTPLSRPAVLKNTNYAATLAGSANDANPGDTLSYRKIAGPAWLNVAANGTLSGTPGNTDTGPNTFTIRVTDAAGLFAETSLSLIVADTNAYWDRDGSTSGAGGTAPTGTWDMTSPWNMMANGTGATMSWLAGQNAVFSAGTNATGTYTVTIAGTQDISGLAFEEGTVTLTGGTALRLVANSIANVTPGLTATVGTPISQDATPRSFTKSGTGTLALSSTNTYTGGEFSGSIQGASTAANSGLFNSSGIIAVTKAGSGTQTLSGTNTYGGATTINGGTLALGANQVLPNTTPVSIGSATLDAATFTDTVGTLNATGSAVIHLGSGAALAFATGSPAWAGTLALSGTFVSGTYAVPDGAANADPGVSVLKNTPAPGKDTVVLSIPRDPDQKKFVRLKVQTS